MDPSDAPLAILPLHWSRLKDLRDVAPLDVGDVACMAELRDVLERHGRVGRFGLHLLHRHFELGDDEVLVEYSDPQRREQHLRVERRDSEALREALPTTWAFGDDGQAIVACVCAWRGGQGHLGRHESG